MSAREEDALVEKLLQIAKRLKSEDGGADPIAAIEALREVREIADSSAGTLRALAEVAEGFLRVIARGEGSDRAMAVYRFIRECDADDGRARATLRSVLSAHGLGIVINGEAAPSFLDLFKTAVLVKGSDDKYRVMPSVRRMVQNAVDPLHFRMWQWVEDARDEVGRREHNRKDNAKILAGKIGCTVDEARDYLQRFPLKTGS